MLVRSVGKEVRLKYLEGFFLRSQFAILKMESDEMIEQLLWRVVYVFMNIKDGVPAHQNRLSCFSGVQFSSFFNIYHQLLRDFLILMQRHTLFDKNGSLFQDDAEGKVLQ